MASFSKSFRSRPSKPIEDLDWDKSVQEYIPRVIAAEDMDSYYMIFMEFVAQLKDSHTLALPPWGYFKPGYDMPPVEIQVIIVSCLIDKTVSTPLRIS